MSCTQRTPQSTNVSGSTTATPLPSIGAPLRTGWGDGHKRVGVSSTASSSSAVAAARQDKLGLWTAVALQNHFRQVGPAPITGDTNRSAGLQTNRLPPAQPRQRRTLAQRMGLVPEPPPAPTEDDWQMAEARALRREQEGGHAMRLGNEVCGICLEPFYETLAQGQVILSCSHVFHENCFKQFERFTRVQQRDEGASAGLQLACPECRLTHYHKRTYFAGKALAQRAAVVRIQAWVRRFLAERRYTQERLRHNVDFRDAYVQQRLAKLSRAWEQYVDRQEAQQEAVLAALDSKRQAAAAAYLSEAEWQTIIDHCEQAAMARLLGSTRGSTGPASSIVLSAASPAVASAYQTLHECPICLEMIERGVTAAGMTPAAPAAGLATALHDVDGGTSEVVSGEAYVERMRREYEQKRAADTQKKRKINNNATSNTKTKASPATTTATPRAGGPKRGTKNDPHATGPSSRATKTKDVTAAPAKATGPLPPSPAVTSALAPPRPVDPAEADGDRAGVILSCGHCFHDVCLGVFERYSEWRVLDEGVTYAPPRCPLCRAGYAKHAF